MGFVCILEALVRSIAKELVEEVKEEMRQKCRRGDQEACEVLKRLEAESRGSPRQGQ